jgi:surface antigen
VGSYRGVNAYSNGSTGYYSGKSNYYNGYRTGIKWQCVEYADRFFKAIFNRQITGGNANTYYSNASAKGLNRAPNGGTNGPRPGNILCSAGGSYGHVAIIREVGPNYIKVIQQNWSNSSSDNSKTLAMTVSNGKYTVSGFSSSYPVQGWLWPK